MKKKILFAYNAMNVGGSTTSLLSILNRLDYSKYDVDLLLNFNIGPLMNLIPEEVNLLPPAWKYYGNPKKERLHRILSPRFMWHFFRSKQIAKESGIPIHAAQYREWKDIEFQRDLPDEYDAAIAFLEGDRCKYVARHVKAKKKIAWIHVNYKDAKFNPAYDRDTMCEFEHIVLVSDDCKDAFNQAFPELQNRSCVIENILANEYVYQRSCEDVAFTPREEKIKLVTSCRISFRKGLDSAVNVFSRLKKNGLLQDVVWYIIGDGGDKPALMQMIADNNLKDEIILLGQKPNPYPYLKQMTAFFLPSKWEGKPMAVTEGFMLGLPALVTEYSSAREQVRHDIDGYIMENSEEGIYRGLRYMIEHPEEIEKWRNHVRCTDYSNVEEIRKIEDLIDG